MPALLRAHLDALARGDVAAALSFYSDDVIFHYPGANPLSGEYRGNAAVLELLGRVMAITRGLPPGCPRHLGER